MTKINFLKMSALGNDFVIIDGRNFAQQTIDEKFTHNQISKIANRKNVGCDQLIILKNSVKADVLMEIYNQDGSKSGACGNATRCVAGYLMEKNNQNQINIETSAGLLKAYFQDGLIAVNMGKPKFNWEEIPFLSKNKTINFVVEEICAYKFSALNIGNPHIVSFVLENLSDKEFFHIAPKLEKNSLFPEKTNVEFAQILSSNEISVRVWERGVGETLACGTAACAVAVLAIELNLILRKNKENYQKIKVNFKGGSLYIIWSKDDSVIMIGSYDKIFEGVFDDTFL